MNILLSCPKCRAALEVDDGLAGSQSECPGCGQWFIVGQGGARLPVAQPPSDKDGKDAARNVPVASHAGAAGEAETGDPRPQHRKCAACGSAMSVAYGEDNVLELPGSATCWMCERCGKEIKVRSPVRILLLLALTPLIAVWAFVYVEAHRKHEETAAWWLRAVEDFALDGSKARVAGYIVFLVISALPPIGLLRELIVRLRHPRIP